jgi:hypothetical protein
MVHAYAYQALISIEEAGQQLLVLLPNYPNHRNLAQQFSDLCYWLRRLANSVPGATAQQP